MSEKASLNLFEGTGVELEYMIVDGRSLDALPVADRLLAAQAGATVSDVEFDDITWSNELVLHVVELKTTGPVADLAPVAGEFARHISRVNDLLARMGGQLMPSAMHPWFDPARETKLWPHDAGPIYAAFDRIFGCRGHGWSNLQSVHVNLPFQGDDEFGRLHAAIRLLLPILPAIAASSPVVDGRPSGLLDTRLSVYRTNCARVPSVTGAVIPEPVFTIGEYHERILGTIYRDMESLDAEGVLREEWVNARGAIARFDRDTIEIRVIDVQECPAADLAIVAATVGALKLLASEAWSDLELQQSLSTEALASILERTIVAADEAMIDDAGYLRALGYRGSAPCRAGELWRHLVAAIDRDAPSSLAAHARALETLLERGPLARRLLRALGPDPGRDALATVYGALCDRLAENRLFEG